EQRLFLDSLKGVLNDFEEIGRVAATTDGPTAVKFFKSEGYDICLIDVGSPRIPWKETITSIRDIDSNAKVVALTSGVCESLVLEAVRLGVKGYLLKDALIDELFLALKQ